MPGVFDWLSGGKRIGGAVNAAAGDIEQGRGDIRELYGEGLGFLQPYQEAGAGALPELASRATRGFSLDQFQADPGYQFALEQGLQATQNAAGVQGSPFGGNAQAAMTQFATGLADQTYNNAFQRWQTETGNLQNLAGLGFNAAGGAANLGAQAGGNMADLLAQLAGLRVQGAGARTQAQSGLLGSLLS